MSEQEKNDVERMAAAVEVLPPDKKSYILGYVEGLTDALADRQIADSIPETMENASKR